MKQKMYVVDAFTDKLFGGNPAAVCVLKEWLPDGLMQHIAMENNLAETAFVVQTGKTFFIRWFTPTAEVALCGHATLASAFVLFGKENFTGREIIFGTAHSGQLKVTCRSGFYELDFPADECTVLENPSAFSRYFNKTPVEVVKGKTDYMLVFAQESDVRDAEPLFPLLTELNARGVIITAPGIGSDFVSRFFAPRCGVNEDPVTGSAHTTLAPYWHRKTGKTKLTARQLSKRGGELHCEVAAGRVKIGGRAKLYSEGEICLS